MEGMGKVGKGNVGKGRGRYGINGRLTRKEVKESVTKGNEGKGTAGALYLYTSFFRIGQFFTNNYLFPPIVKIYRNQICNKFQL